MWQTPYRRFHPGLRDEAVEYVLRQLVVVRRIVHEVLSLPEFGKAQFIQEQYVPIDQLYPREQRFTASGLVLVMTERWPLEIQHPFGCQQFDGGYYYEEPGTELCAPEVLAKLSAYGLRLEPLSAVLPQAPAMRDLSSRYPAYVIDEVQGATGQRVTFDPRLWANARLSGPDMAKYFQTAVQGLGITD